MSITPIKAKTRSILSLLGAVLASALLMLAMASPAKAEFGFAEPFDGTTLDENGDPFTQAGGHPDAVSAGFKLNTKPDPNGSAFLVPDGQFRDVQVDLPPGVVGDPSATPQCTMAQLAIGIETCPSDTQIGTIQVHTPLFSPTTKLYNLVTPPGKAASFGFNAIILINLQARVRSDDFGITLDSPNSPQASAIIGVTPTFWGVPADHNAALTIRKPLLTQPTSCTGPMQTSIRMNSWDDPDTFITSSFLSHDNDTPPNPIGQDGCEAVPFTPTVNVQPTQSKADSPSGLEFEIQVPDEGIKNPDGVSQAHLKDVEVTLPEGMAVNPSSVDGLNACSEAQIGLGDDSEAACPDSSKIGTVEITTPVLEETLEGSVYLAEQDTNPFNSLLALYLTAENEARGINIKLAGEVSPDENTGQLVTTFEDQPQLPFNTFNVRFKGGDRAPLATPSTCGEYDIVTSLTPWSGNPPVTKTSSFVIDKAPDGGACLAGDAGEAGDPADLGDRPFDPELSGGLLSSTAGGFSPFVFKLTRPDGHQEILSTEVSPPEGVTAKLAGVPLCEEVDVQAGNCNESNRIGTEIAASGAGPSPFYTVDNPGAVYMAGPYDPDGAGPAPEAPLSMLIEEPVIAGPFDLDDVSVRAAVYVDPETARLTVVSDEIPQINSGIPLRIRALRIKVDRPDFTVAPTDCNPKQLEAVAHGSHGAEANLATHFQVSDCGGLDFDPEFDFQANNNDATDRSDHPALDTTVDFNQPAGAYASANGVRPKANIAKAEVTLPSSIILDQDSLETICTREDYADESCPANTQYGTAVAHSPLLDEPLSGPVYLRASDNPLPDLVADLDGIIDIDLAGEISQTGGKNSRLRTTFASVPDQAVSSFNLKLNGGSNGLLVNSQNVCASKDRRTVDVKVFGQNNATAHQQPRIGIGACERKADRKADRLERKAKQLKRKAKQAKRKGNRKKARKLKRKANKKLRQAKRTRRAAS